MTSSETRQTVLQIGGGLIVVAIALAFVWAFWTAYFGMLEAMAEADKRKAAFFLECLERAPKDRCALEWKAYH